MSGATSDDVSGFGDAESAPSAPHYILQLYIAGTTPRSAQALASIRTICEAYLKDRYDLEVIDMSRGSAWPDHEQIVAMPMLLRKYPLPLRRLIGDMSRIDRVLKGLDIRESAEAIP